MSSVNVMAREVAAKIVFYGPGLSGKTTTLKKIYESVRPAHRGEMISLPTEADRTLFFDFLPVKVERVGDFSVRLALYTVPGQVFYNATRKLVLQGADGVVFVVDSQPEALDSNRESMQNLEENLLEQGIRLERFPLIVQYNKRDIAKSLPVEHLRQIFNPRGVPEFETCATNGRGVLDTLKAITRLVIKDLRTKRVVPAPRGEAEARIPALTGAAPGLEDEIQQHLNRPAPPQREVLRGAATSSRAGGSVPDLKLRPRVQSGPGPVQTLGCASALAPSELIDYTRAADSAFAAGDYAGCVRTSLEAVRRALSYAGDASLAGQAHLLGVDGPDLLRLQGLANAATSPRVDDAAFALFVLMQSLVRLSSADLPARE